MLEQDCYACKYEIFQSSLDGLWYMRIENANWDDYNDCMDYTDVLVNHCYECGKSFVAVDEVKGDQINLPPRNPNKRTCVAKNITFSTQEESEKLVRSLI